MALKTGTDDTWYWQFPAAFKAMDEAMGHI
jgi:hypothetical protein